jgi:hypothetical protein
MQSNTDELNHLGNPLKGQNFQKITMKRSSGSRVARKSALSDIVLRISAYVLWSAKRENRSGLVCAWDECNEMKNGGLHGSYKETS